ncbi:MAG: hypothetical protein K2X69_05265 [Silvanigrellaceae bacterium]|nr:hypothetical protein [Silvanigrellaceae bacterium]
MNTKKQSVNTAEKKTEMHTGKVLSHTVSLAKISSPGKIFSIKNYPQTKLVETGKMFFQQLTRPKPKVKEARSAQDIANEIYKIYIQEIDDIDYFVSD